MKNQGKTKIMYELFIHAEFSEEERTVDCEIRKVKMPDDTESGEQTFDMSGKCDEDTAFVYDTLEVILNYLDEVENLVSVHIRKPGTGVQVVAINGEPVKPLKLFEEWTEKELEELEDYI